MVLRQQRLRFIGVQVRQYHHNGGFTVAATRCQRLLRAGIVTFGGLLNDVDLPLHQFLIGGFYVDHQVAVHFAAADHGAGGQHIEHQLLRGAGFHA